MCVWNGSKWIRNGSKQRAIVMSRGHGFCFWKFEKLIEKGRERERWKMCSAMCVWTEIDHATTIRAKWFVCVRHMRIGNQKKKVDLTIVSLRAPIGQRKNFARFRRWYAVVSGVVEFSWGRSRMQLQIGSIGRERERTGLISLSLIEKFEREVWSKVG